MLTFLLLFLVVVIFIRLKIPTGLSLILAAVFLGFYSYGFDKELKELVLGWFFNLNSWKLVLTVGVVITFARVFESAQLVRSLVISLESFLPPSLVSKAAPALVGLVPMPGGAMVSAPIVKQIARNDKISPENLTATNYWWRHVWEASWPFYANLILASAILKISIWKVAMINFPISLAAIASGFLLKRVGSTKRCCDRPNPLLFLESLWPIFLMVVLGLVLKLDLILSAALATILLMICYKIPLVSLVKGLKSGFSPAIVILIFGVMTLAATIEKTGTAFKFYEDLIEMNLPSYVVLFGLPFFIGLLTGVGSAYVGVGFPLVITLLASPSLSDKAGIFLAFAGGFAGIMSSPVHLCLVLTKDYFGASLVKTLAFLIPTIVLTSILSWGLAFIFYMPKSF